MRITDQSNILEGITIERHFFSLSQLQKMDGVWKNIPEAMKLASKKKGDSTDPYEVQSNIPQVEVWEVYMDVPDTLNPANRRNGNKYSPVQLLIATNTKEKVLLHAQEKEKPYKYLPWEEVAGRGLGRGQVEDGFEAQMWTNDAVIAQKNAMDLASKVIIPTTLTLPGGNGINDLDTGQLLPMDSNDRFEPTSLLPNGLPELSNMIDLWDKQYSEVASSFNAISGEELPSGTPFRSVALQSRQSASYFDYKREEFGIFVKEIIEEWILPELTKRLSKPHTLVTQLPASKIEMVDDLFIGATLDTAIKKFVKKNKIPPTHEQVEAERQRLIEHLSQTDNTRYLDMPKGYFKGVKTRITIDPTGEANDKAAETDRLIGFAEFIAQAQATGNPGMIDIARQVSNKLNLDIDFSNFAVGGAAPNVSTNAPEGDPAITKEIDNALPVAQQ